MHKSENKKEFWFILLTSILSVVIGLLYLCKGLIEGFYAGTYIIMVFSVIYVPVVCIFKRTGFALYNLIYGIVLIFIIAFYKTYLYNNYTGLLAMFVVMMIKPNLKKVAIIIYALAVTVAFILNEETVYHYLIHIARALWLFLLFDFVLKEKYELKKLILNEDEIKILTELSKNRLQKSLELEGFSESTIYRRIRSAMERNKLSKKELIEAFMREKSE